MVRSSGDKLFDAAAYLDDLADVAGYLQIALTDSDHHPTAFAPRGD